MKVYLSLIVLFFLVSCFGKSPNIENNSFSQDTESGLNQMEIGVSHIAPEIDDTIEENF